MIDLRLFDAGRDRAGLAALRAEAAREGDENLEKLAEELASPDNPYRPPGFLLAAWIEGRLVGLGGAIEDPYAPEPGVRRVRRVYVHPSARRRGVGRAIAAAIIARARGTADRLVLRAGPPGAAIFWERLGFCPVTHPTRSHVLALGMAPATEAAPRLAEAERFG